ncbi:MAG: asparagine synthase (glutamine-hydrolyzing) [Bacteroidetes bacterium]|nr:asparagine synthase (glutamine-hydrolyzing) [Bacteroidota bacterium]
MCGISGIVKFDGASDELRVAIRKMNSAIRHRGPDGEGFVFGDENWKAIATFSEDTPIEISSSRFPHSPTVPISTLSVPTNLVLAHRRLAILDLSPAGHQPLCSADQLLWITYNGEVYNYPELRTELENLGHTFFTNTDTEIVLAAYRQWGKECMQKFNGMWAFVIWDREKKILFGSRDRFGVKPFYYYKNKSVFTFASEQKAFLKNSFVTTELNSAAVADYFIAGEIEYGEESFLKNIIELFPGNAFELSLNNGAFKKWKWYSLPETEDKAIFSEQQYKKYIEQTRELLVNAIRIRLRSDVPVGSCLSGGIDSSAIVGIIGDLISKNEKVNVGDRLKLFTAVFDEANIDERKWAKEMVDRTGADWFTVQPKPEEFIRDVKELMYCQDVPIWSTSTYAQFRTMKLAHDNGIRVVLDGQGGDELFAGYFPYYIPFWTELKNNGERARRKSEIESFGEGATKYRLRELLKQKTVPSLPVKMQLSIQRNYFPDVNYLDEHLIAEYISNYKQKIIPNTLNKALSSEFVDTRLKGYLKCEDRCSMWHSVESRTPFSDDHLLIEAVFKMPGMMKIKNGVTKYILREAAAPFIPDSIRNRRDKMGYATPNNKWVSDLKEQFRPYFEQDLTGIIDKKKLMKDYDSFFSIENKPENGRVFKFMAFAVWKETMGI